MAASSVRGIAENISQNSARQYGALTFASIETAASRGNVTALPPLPRFIGG
jgi:hypothetical protein